MNDWRGLNNEKSKLSGPPGSRYLSVKSQTCLGGAGKLSLMEALPCRMLDNVLPIELNATCTASTINDVVCK